MVPLSLTDTIKTMQGVFGRLSLLWWANFCNLFINWKQCCHTVYYAYGIAGDHKRWVKIFVIFVGKLHGLHEIFPHENVGMLTVMHTNEFILAKITISHSVKRISRKFTLYNYTVVRLLPQKQRYTHLFTFLKLRWHQCKTVKILSI